MWSQRTKKGYVNKIVGNNDKKGREVKMTDENLQKRKTAREKEKIAYHKKKKKKYEGEEYYSLPFFFSLSLRHLIPNKGLFHSLPRQPSPPILLLTTSSRPFPFSLPRHAPLSLSVIHKKASILMLPDCRTQPPMFADFSTRKLPPRPH